MREAGIDRFIQSGLLDACKRLSITDLEQVVLTLQAMWLGGWMFTGINPPSLLGALACDGVPGLGFRFTQNPSWTQPNPVGLDDAFVVLKFGPGGTFDPARPGPYCENAHIKASVARYSAEMIEMLGEVAQYLHDVFGKFPASIPSIYVRVYAQAQHIDLDYYDAVFGPDAYLETLREHPARWHDQSREQTDLGQDPAHTVTSNMNGAGCTAGPET